LHDTYSREGASVVHRLKRRRRKKKQQTRLLGRRGGGEGEERSYLGVFTFARKEKRKETLKEKFFATRMSLFKKKRRRGATLKLKKRARPQGGGTWRGKEEGITHSLVSKKGGGEKGVISH